MVTGNNLSIIIFFFLTLCFYSLPLVHIFCSYPLIKRFLTRYPDLWVSVSNIVHKYKPEWNNILNSGFYKGTNGQGFFWGGTISLLFQLNLVLPECGIIDCKARWVLAVVDNGTLEAWSMWKKIVSEILRYNLTAVINRSVMSIKRNSGEIFKEEPPPQQNLNWRCTMR